MEFSIKRGSPEKQRGACVVVGVFEPRKLTRGAESIDNIAHKHLSDIIHRGDMEGKSGSTLLLHNVPSTLCERVLLVGLGKEKEFHEKAYCAAIRSAVKALNETGATDGTIFLTENPVKKRGVSWRIRQAAMIAQETVYRFDQFKSTASEGIRPLRKLSFTIERRESLAQAEEALAQGLATAEGVSLARTLGNLPGNVCTPGYLAETAQQMAKEHAMECQVLERADMEALGMQALLSVARGSHIPPKMIVMQYKGMKVGKGSDKATSGKPIVLIGKGITFDSGGISLKPGLEMDEMKFDMCGAASVLGTLKAVARMKLPINLTVIVPTTENMPGGSASKPGDIVTSMSGQTIEILNTDAEGRLILCDAMTYAERFNPETVIDVATLTGACVIALGHVATGLFANDDGLAHKLLQAGDDAQDRAWQMPLWEDYQDLLKSPFADMANIGGRAAGSVSAACFLSRYCKKFAWAHLDIAGTAWKSGADKGATGRPVPLLVHYLLTRSGKLN
ncbi:leucyl aminopeptidase [Propionivibrio sp.]|uniref:leucyl aminopeptidase n=1 Tax=Propionivibrio sp. TaxID=2212460 RepID=UPI0025D6EFA4|nr:leucyl aminopeptidase [Propionivibrio sp.]MBK7355785.1 leucyl aminopeptidase [Propionivibrio sp.]MBK8400551.1 leucyl aminopeptidase [Propionivibrio sp.]MBK8895185.1 leucyl aminopeptidase [Propionivibrio sp.]MBL0206910.1 leucyl aminopeptidase [Propionivibrio sp.]